MATRKAKIVATIGPSTQSTKALRDLLTAGMNVARLNFSHGTHEEHAQVIQRLRNIAKEDDKALAILQDLQGSKVRTGYLPADQTISAQPGKSLILTADQASHGSDVLQISHEKLYQDVQVGDRILIDDGRIELQVSRIKNSTVETEILIGGEIGSHKGINIPNARISTTPLTSKDHTDLEFGLKHGVDAIALSFVREPTDVLELRKTITDQLQDSRGIPIIAKLECGQAIENLDAILDVADGVMIARGDLGVELSPEKVPAIQKQIIQRANQQLVTVITATQMLESMMQHPKPTRAESSDVANAVFDGSDCLMLSGETAVGDYPSESVQTMHRIIAEAEIHADKWGKLLLDPSGSQDEDAIATAHAAKRLAEDRDVKAIAVFTLSGRTAKLLSKVRPRVPIIAFTPNEDTLRQMPLLWGVEPYLVSIINTVEHMIDLVGQALKSTLGLKPGQQVVIVTSLPVGGEANLTLLHTLI